MNIEEYIWQLNQQIQELGKTQPHYFFVATYNNFLESLVPTIKKRLTKTEKTKSVEHLTTCFD